MTESGRLCAFITKVKKGSLADSVGHLRPGKRSIQFNSIRRKGQILFAFETFCGRNGIISIF